MMLFVSIYLRIFGIWYQKKRAKTKLCIYKWTKFVTTAEKLMNNVLKKCKCIYIITSLKIDINRQSLCTYT